MSANIAVVLHGFIIPTFWTFGWTGRIFHKEEWVEESRNLCGGDQQGDNVLDVVRNCEREISEGPLLGINSGSALEIASKLFRTKGGAATASCDDMSILDDRILMLVGEPTAPLPKDRLTCEQAKRFMWLSTKWELDNTEKWLRSTSWHSPEVTVNILRGNILRCKEVSMTSTSCDFMNKLRQTCLEYSEESLLEGERETAFTAYVNEILLRFVDDQIAYERGLVDSPSEEDWGGSVGMEQSLAEVNDDSAKDGVVPKVSERMLTFEELRRKFEFLGTTTPGPRLRTAEERRKELLERFHLLPATLVDPEITFSTTTTTFAMTSTTTTTIVSSTTSTTPTTTEITETSTNPATTLATTTTTTTIVSSTTSTTPTTTEITETSTNPATTLATTTTSTTIVSSTTSTTPTTTEIPETSTESTTTPTTTTPTSASATTSTTATASTVMTTIPTTTTTTLADTTATSTSTSIRTTLTTTTSEFRATSTASTAATAEATTSTAAQETNTTNGDFKPRTPTAPAPNLAQEVQPTSIPLPTLDEYKFFLDVKNTTATLQDITRIGVKVAAHLGDLSWKVEHFGMRRFLHRADSALMLKLQSKPLMKELMSDTPLLLRGRTIIIAGAGPGGLRLAVEAAVMGATVHVVEKRSFFNRYNILRLWTFSMADLVSVGIKDLLPNFGIEQVRRIPIAILQHVLLRSALAVGVVFHPACALESLKSDSISPRLQFSDTCPSKQELENVRFDAIIDGTGTQALLRDSEYAGEKPVIQSSKTTSAESIGLVMNFKRFQQGESDFMKKACSEWDDNLKLASAPSLQCPAQQDSMNLAYQFSVKLFNEKKVSLKNWVYWRSDMSHYIVATVARKAFADFGVVPPEMSDRSVDELVKSINKSKLVDMGLKMAKEWSFPHESEDVDAFIVNGAGNPDIEVFDYGKTVKVTTPIRFLSQNILFGVVGDSVETPFWPLGTGANHALYTAHAQSMMLVAWLHFGYSQDELTSMAPKFMYDVLHIEDDVDYYNDRAKGQELYNNVIYGNYRRLKERKSAAFGR